MVLALILVRHFLETSDMRRLSTDTEQVKQAINYKINILSGIQEKTWYWPFVILCLGASKLLHNFNSTFPCKLQPQWMFGCLLHNVGIYLQCHFHYDLKLKFIRYGHVTLGFMLMFPHCLPFLRSCFTFICSTKSRLWESPLGVRREWHRCLPKS